MTHPDFPPTCGEGEMVYKNPVLVRLGDSRDIWECYVVDEGEVSGGEDGGEDKRKICRTFAYALVCFF
jgi:hypothetical protein